MVMRFGEGADQEHQGLSGFIWLLLRSFRLILIYPKCWHVLLSKTLSSSRGEAILLVAVTFAWEERKPRGQDSWMLGTAIQMVKRVDCRGIGVV